jgi:hypothetical protein
VTRRQQRQRNFEEQIKNLLQQCALEAMRRGEYGRFRVDSVYVGPDMMLVRGDLFAAEAGAKLFREAGLLNVEVYPDGEKPDSYIASGAVR